MDAVLNLPLKQLEDKHRQSIADEDAFRAEKKINPAYLGNIYHSANHGANIPEELNCSLFIYNLPAHMTEKSLIEALLPHAPFDRIYALSVTPPSAGSFSDTSIAKITTFTRAGAEKLYNFIHAGWLAISGQQTRVRWNQIKVAAFPGDEYLSRVLLISGPKDVVTIPNLTAHLSRGIAYQLEAATVKQETADIRLIEWRFCSFRAQASSAKLLLRWELPAVTTRFGVDPLAVPLRAVPAGPRRFPPWDRSTEWV
ncbi:hypothetical protein B0T25DRAFT_444583 [Lasiosphaeria hispida]|uniref:RRM domain-containing protein n=1 Tax=Lasiosphaeria hispida TaxID=260671 RepID=A0AAJ0MLA2_9PEZI|nr:hypothetical protein B0T25DRAFT_444583 [Lasiosphaeria hispida]